MKKSEFQFLVKLAEEKVRRKNEIKYLVKAAAYEVRRKNELKSLVKAATFAFEKRAQSYGAVVLGKLLNSISRFGRAAGAKANLGERIGSQLMNTGFRKTIGGGLKRYWRNLIGANEREFLKPFGSQADELVNAGRASIRELEEAAAKRGGKLNADRLAAYDKRVGKNLSSDVASYRKARMDELASGKLDTPEVADAYLEATKNFNTPKRTYNAAARHAARLRSTTNKTRLGTAIAAPVVLGGGAYALGGDGSDYYYS